MQGGGLAHEQEEGVQQFSSSCAVLMAHGSRPHGLMASWPWPQGTGHRHRHSHHAASASASALVVQEK